MFGPTPLSPFAKISWNHDSTVKSIKVVVQRCPRAVQTLSTPQGEWMFGAGIGVPNHGIVFREWESGLLYREVYSLQSGSLRYKVLDNKL